jgi:hypothetical protein
VRDGWPFFSVALAMTWRCLYALIVVAVVAVLAPLIAAALWPMYSRVGIGVSVVAFAAAVLAKNITMARR